MGLSSSLRLLAKSPIQVVTLGGVNALDVYTEYLPYTFELDKEKLVNMVISGDVPGTPIKEFKKAVRDTYVKKYRN